MTEEAKPGWKPSGSTLVGGGVGLFVGQIIVGVLTYLGIDLGDQTFAAINALCVLLGNYLHTDGGRS